MTVLAACAVLSLAEVASPGDAWEDGQAGSPPSHFIPDALLSASCSRSSSREAKKLFTSYLDAVFREAPAHISSLGNSSVILGPDCPFAAGNGLFDEQEALKKQHRYNQWQCSSCDKYFKSEAYLDQHFHNRHAAELGQVGHRYCLADYCGVLGGCRPVTEQPPACSPKVAARLQHSCSLLASVCFAAQHADAAVTDFAAAAAAKFRRKLCAALSCSGSGSGDDGDDIGFWERSRFVLFVIFLILVAVYYFGLYLSHADTRVRSDIASIGSKHRSNRAAILKEKAY